MATGAQFICTKNFMATAAANLLIQTNPMKWKQSYPNNLFRSIPAKPVKLKSFVSTAEKSHLITTDPKSNPGGHAESLQFRWGNNYCTIKENRPSANPNTAVKKPWKYALKALRKAAAAAVLVGMLLMYKPKSALADSVGRVRATLSPYSDSDWNWDSWKLFMASQQANMMKTFVASQWIVLYPWMAYAVVIIVLFIICRLLQWLEPSWMESVLDRKKFLLLFPILHLSWVLVHNPSTVFKLQLQVSLSNTGRALQTDLNRIAETADTSTYEGLTSIMTEIAVAFDRHPDCFISASSYVAEKIGEYSAQNYLDQLSLQERVNFYEKQLVDVNNLKRKRSRGRKSANKIQDEYMEVTILVAVDGKHKLLAINSVDDLKKALQKLVSINPNNTVYVYGVEVLWKPLRAGQYN